MRQSANLNPDCQEENTEQRAESETKARFGFGSRRVKGGILGVGAQVASPSWGGAIDEAGLDTVVGRDRDIDVRDFVGNVGGCLGVPRVGPDLDECGVTSLADSGEIAELSDRLGSRCVRSDAGVFSESGEAAQIGKRLGKDAIGADAFKFILYKVRIGNRFRRHRKGLGLDGFGYFEASNR